MRVDLGAALRPPHRASTAQLQALFPFVSEQGLFGTLLPGADARVRAVTMALTAARLYASITTRPRRRLLVIDEAWFLLRDAATIEWLRAQWKLCRTLGTGTSPSSTTPATSASRGRRHHRRAGAGGSR